jgi:hypothetical protein
MQRTFNKAERKPYFRNGSLGVDITAGKLWTPAELGASLVGWWDASDSSTITIATGVSTITDKTTNNRSFTQSTGANQPALIANAQNGLSVLRFDGSNDFLQTSARITIRTFICLAKWAATTGEYRHFWDMSTTSQYGWHGATSGSGNLLDASFASPLVRDGSKYVNGTLTATNLARYTSWTIHGFETTADINPQFTGYQSGNPGREFLGDYAEWMYLNAVPSTTNRQLIEGYLAWKWGLQASLPNDHPYKAAPPTL